MGRTDTPASRNTSSFSNVNIPHLHPSLSDIISDHLHAVYTRLQAHTAILYPHPKITA